ncbi:MAG: CheR family methyltransferase [bacterium]
MRAESTRAGAGTATKDTLSKEQIEFISQFIYQRSGILLGESKRYLIENRLRSVAKMAGLQTVSDVCRELANNPPQLQTLVLDALTTNETLWFRDTKPFEALEKVILPAIFRAKTSKVLQVWSAACSTGQEPYSIAMTIAESGLFKDWLVRVVATDISTSALDHAREGIYSQLEVSRGLPVRLLMKYFVQIGHVWKIKPEVKAHVAFRHHVLQNDATGLGRFDLIFCRNVLIYFDIETKRTILDRIHRVMTNEGLLALGGSETALNVSDKFEGIKICRAPFYAKHNSHHPWHTVRTE